MCEMLKSALPELFLTFEVCTPRVTDTATFNGGTEIPLVIILTGTCHAKDLGVVVNLYIKV